MKRTGFARPPRPENLPVPLSPSYRPASYAGTTSGIAMPKEPRLENQHLLLMARNVKRPCLLVIHGLCVSSGRDTNCCACHGNSHVWNKGGGMKAHDFFSVWGCPRCHTWLDASYSASGEERDLAFRRALGLQVIYWDIIAMGPSIKDADAARWALDHLIERGYATRSTHVGQYAAPDLKAIHARQP